MPADTPARSPAPLQGSQPSPLVIDDVHRSWGPRPVLMGASLTLAPGSVTWLGGPNGAGKTTLLRIVAGLLAPQRGSVSVFGLDIERQRDGVARHLGFLSAGDRGLQARLTVTHNLELWAGLALVPRARRAARIGAALHGFALEELAAQRVDRLSMGQRQRVRLAQTFLHDPGLVLLDEPHTSLDDAGLALIERAIDGVRSRGGAVLWCSPASAKLPLEADAHYLLRDGALVRR